MLDIAIKHQIELKEKMRDIWFSEKYKYWNCSVWYNEKEICLDTWSNHQFVSLNKSGEVIGYIGYEINRANEYCNSLNIINFSDDKVTFGIDLRQALKDIFEKFKFRKLKFSVVVGNPIETSYDELVKKYGGKIVGVYKKDVKLFDGEYYDHKYYEIFREDYLKAKGDNL